MNSNHTGWFEQARFGMFIHWGLYSIPAGVWNGAEVPGLSEWIMCQAHIPFEEYRQLAAKFNPTAFGAAAIARLAKSAGMKYVVVTAKHHDGFAMFDSKVDDYNIVHATPYGRDPMRDLAQACADEGLVFCFYYSQDLDWAHPGGGGSGGAPVKTNFQQYLDEKAKPQISELLTNYGPIGLMWFDVPANVTEDQSRDLRDLVHSLQPHCLVSGRVGHNMGDFGSLGDNQIPVGHVHGLWDIPATLNDSWAFRASDHNWKSAETVITTLVDAASKGANYLLNIGPDSTGAVPEESVKILEEVGRWMETNGEAIYGSSPSPFESEFDWGQATAGNGKLYFILEEPQEYVLRVSGLRNGVSAVACLGQKCPNLMFNQNYDSALNLPTLIITLPDLPLEDYPLTIACTIDGEIDADPMITEQQGGRLHLFAHTAELHRANKEHEERDTQQGETVAAEAAEIANDAVHHEEMGISLSGLTENWTDTDDWMSWHVLIATPGRFEVFVNTVAPKYKKWEGGHTVEVRSGSQCLSHAIEHEYEITSHRTYHFEEAATRMGYLRFDRPGTFTISLHAAAINPAVANGFCVSEVALSPEFPS